MGGGSGGFEYSQAKTAPGGSKTPGYFSYGNEKVFFYWFLFLSFFFLTVHLPRRSQQDSEKKNEKGYLTRSTIYLEERSFLK